VTRFQHFYAGVYSGRKLSWLYNLSKGELVANCFKNRYTFQASTMQICVLMLYNGSNTTLTMRQIQETTQIEEQMLQQVCLGGHSSGKTKFLFSQKKWS
jgi:cullin 1